MKFSCVPTQTKTKYAFKISSAFSFQKFDYGPGQCGSVGWRIIP